MTTTWLWMGSSNTKAYKSQFEAPNPNSRIDTQKFELCTKLEHFKEHFPALKDKCDFATISGLDNILADLTKEEWDEPKLMQEIDQLFKTLEEQRMEGVKIMIEPLIPWKKHTDTIRRAGIDIFKNMKINYPGILFSTRPSSLRFTKDGVHLDDRSSRKMFPSTYHASEELFTKADDDDMSGHETGDDDHNRSMQSLGPDEEVEFIGRRQAMPPRTSDWSEEIDAQNEASAQQQHSIHNDKFAKLVNEVKDLRSDMDDRWELDLIVHAGTKEDLDKIENNLNMNKVVVSGIEVPEIWDQDNWKGRVAHIKDAIAELFKFIDPDHDYNLGYIKHLNQGLHASRQIVEVSLDTEKHGRGIRKCLANKIKNWKEKGSFPPKMNGVSISPSLTIATRVRIAILKAIAKIIRSELKGHDSWVIQHAARPVIKIEITLEDNRKVENSYGFAQAIAFMIKELPHRKISDQDLFDAYTIAGTRFGPELSHHFVLLNYNTALSMAKERARKGSKKTQKPKDSTGPKSTSGQQAKKKGGPQGMAQKPSGSQDPKSVGNKTGQGTSQSAKN